MARRTYKKPHRAKKVKPFFVKAAFWRSAFFAAAAGGLVWLVCFSPALEVKEINIAGAQRIDSGDAAKFIDNEVNKKIGFFDSKSILLLNLDQTKKELLEKFPQIQNIKIQRQFPSKIYASIEERRGVAFFDAANEKKYSIDSDGIAFEEISHDASGMLRIIDSRESNPRIGQEAVKKDLISIILRMKGDMQSVFGIVVDSALIETPERVNLLTGEGWYVYFSPIKDIDSQLLKLAAVLNEESFKAKRSNLEYVDIRFTRVYLKEKSAEIDSETKPRGSASSTEE